MKQKLVFLTIFVVNVQILYGFRYPQYEYHAAVPKGQSVQQEVSATHSKTDFKSYPPLGSLSKTRGDQRFGQWLERRFNSLGSDTGLRKFQKATNSLRRANIDESEGKNVCVIPRKNQKEKEKHMRRTETETERESFTDDIDLNALDRKIQQLIRLRTLQKFKQALNSVLTDDYGSLLEDGNKTELKRRMNDDISAASNYDSNEESSDEDDESEDIEGSGSEDDDENK